MVKIVKRTGLCAAMACVMLLAACGEAGTLKADSAASASGQVSGGSTAAPVDKSKYVYPEEAKFAQPPAYTKPEELQPMIFSANYYSFNATGGAGNTPIDVRLVYTSMDDGEGERSIPTPLDAYWQAGNSAFIGSEDFVAVTWGMDILNFGLSRDGGQSWKITEVDVIPFKWNTQAVEFINESLGWLTVKESEGTRLLLYKTADGGKSWQRVCLFNRPQALHFRFASKEVGWMVEGNYYESVAFYETIDGGQTWYPVSLRSNSPEATSDYFTPRFLPGYSLLLGWMVKEPKSWELGPASLYLAPGQKAMWERCPQGAPLPEGLTYPLLESMVPALFPIEYNWRQGLNPKEMDSFSLSCQTLQYIRENYGEGAVAYPGGKSVSMGDGEALLSVAQIKEYVKYQYNASDFDVTQMEDYDSEAGGLWHSCGHGGFGLNMFLRIAKPLPDGDIELYFDVVRGVLGTMDGEVDRGTAIYFMLVRPQLTPGGKQIITLLECRPLTPLPKNQGLFYSV